MKKCILYFLLISICLLNKLHAQVTLVDTIQVAGLDRYYRVYTPAMYDGSMPVPLLLNLHGYSSNAFQQEFYGEFRNIADTANFIIVCPDGTTDGFGFQFWNCFTADNIGVDDVQFLSQLIDTISAEYTIDANRIYSTGMSNGGFMSYTLAGELSDRIAAVASVTGSISYDRFPAIAPSHPTPVMEIHGTADGTVPYYGSDIFLPIEDVVDYWVNYNGCNPTAEVIEVPDINPGDGCTATHFIYSGGANGTNVELFRINDGGHTWPGTIFLLGVTNKDINASLEIWKFFSKYRLDVLNNTNEQQALENLQIHVTPNPAWEKITVTTNNNAVISHIAVIDINGKTVLEDKTNWIATAEISIQNISPGIYTVAMLIDGKYRFQKIIKQ